MSQPISFYIQQAANCGEAAAAAKLANERDKYLQAQTAWQALADAAAKRDEDSAKREAARASA